MKTQNEILDIGFKDYLNNGSVIFIEWPEHIENLLPQSTIKIHIAHTVEDENSRWIKLENV
jgi:tRNA threonylcarbamoyladenosine biosynthesis protein TsaE